VEKPFERRINSEFLFDRNLLLNPETSKLPQIIIIQNLLAIGIKGLIVCSCGGDKPIALRNYENAQVESIDGAYFICGLSHILNKFALTNFGFFTDVGFGYKRVIFKFKTENNLTLCLILSEVIYKRISGETLNIFSELMLQKIHKSIKSFIPNLKELSFEDETSEIYQKVIDQLDSIMLENAKIIYKELNM
jgi:hypothetical protein